MIKILPSELHLALSLGRLRGTAEAIDGTKSQPHLLSFTYDGGNSLTFQCTNNRVSLRTLLKVRGQAAPWAASVLAWRFEGLREVDGGHLSIGPQGDSVLLLTKTTLRLCFPRQRDDSPSTFNETMFIPETVRRAQADADAFEFALKTLPGSPGKFDAESCTQLTAFFGTGEAMATVNELRTVVAGPQMPFDLYMHLRDASFLRRWLRLIRKDLGALEQLELTLGADQTERHYYKLSVEGQRHSIIIPASKRLFPRQVIDSRRQEIPALRAAAERNPIERFFRLTSWSRRRGRVGCCFTHDESGWKLELTELGEHAGGSQTVVNVSPSTEPDTQAAGGRFEVNARQMKDALGRLRGEQVTLIYRPKCRTLSVAEEDAGRWVELLLTACPLIQPAPPPVEPQ